MSVLKCNLVQKVGFLKYTDGWNCAQCAQWNGYTALDPATAQWTKRTMENIYVILQSNNICVIVQSNKTLSRELQLKDNSIIFNGNMFRLLLQSHLHAEPQNVLYILWQTINHCKLYITLFMFQPEDGSIRRDEICCCYKWFIF